MSPEKHSEHISHAICHSYAIAMLCRSYAIAWSRISSRTVLIMSIRTWQLPNGLIKVCQGDCAILRRAGSKLIHRFGSFQPPRIPQLSFAVLWKKCCGEREGKRYIHALIHIICRCKNVCAQLCPTCSLLPGSKIFIFHHGPTIPWKLPWLWKSQPFGEPQHILGGSIVHVVHRTQLHGVFIRSHRKIVANLSSCAMKHLPNFQKAVLSGSVGVWEYDFVVHADPHTLWEESGCLRGASEALPIMNCYTSLALCCWNTLTACQQTTFSNDNSFKVQDMQCPGHLKPLTKFEWHKENWNPGIGLFKYEHHFPRSDIKFLDDSVQA